LLEYGYQARRVIGVRVGRDRQVDPRYAPRLEFGDYLVLVGTSVDEDSCTFAVPEKHRVPLADIEYRHAVTRAEGWHRYEAQHYQCRRQQDRDSRPVQRLFPADSQDQCDKPSAVEQKRSDLD